MRTKQTLAILATIIALLGASAGRAATGAYRSAATGNWGTLATWERDNGTSWATPTSGEGTPTSSSGVITIRSPHIVSVATNVIADQVIVESGGQITVNSGFTLTIADGAGADLDVSGVVKNAGIIALNSTGTPMIIFESAGKYQHNFTTTAGAIPAATWASSSTCEIIGYTSNPDAPPRLGQAFGNFTWNSPNQTADVSLGGGLTNVTGDLTIASTGSGSLRLLNSTGANYAPTVGGSFIQSGGTFYVYGTGTGYGGSITVNVSGAFSLSAGTLNLSGADRPGTINVAGNFSHTGGTLTKTGTSTAAAIVFNGAGTQTYTSGGTVSGAVNFTVNSGATLMTGTSLVGDGSSGTFTLSSGATLGIGDPSGITTSGANGNIRVSGTRAFNAGANYIYNGTVAQATGNGLPATVNNLTINNSAGVTLNSSPTLSGALTLTSGILATGANQINVANTANNSVTVGAGWVNGALQKSFGATGNPQSFTFPIGDSANYEPLALASLSPSVAGSIRVSTTPGSHPQLASSGINSIAKINQYWTLTEVSGTYGAYNATFNYPSGEGSGDASAYIVKRWNTSSSTWSSATVNGTPTTTATSVTGMSGSGDFAIGDVAPVATADSATRNAGMSLKVLKSDLLANDTGANISFTSVNSPSTGGATLAASGLYVFYTPNSAGDEDHFTYTITDTYGATANGIVTVHAASQPPGGASGSITVSGSVTTVTFYGIPGMYYNVERTVSIVPPSWTPLLASPPLDAAPPIRAAADGSVRFTDNFSDLGVPPASLPASAYYRLVPAP